MSVKISEPSTAIETIARWILDSHHLVVFSGAERGEGLPGAARDLSLSRADGHEVADLCAEPDAGLEALRALQSLGRLRLVIAQETSGRHRRAGLRPDVLVELHGNADEMRCLCCDGRIARQRVGWDAARFGEGRRARRPSPGQPACPSCAGRLISSVVRFGDPLPERELTLAHANARACDLMLVLGAPAASSSAAALIGVALGAGARVALLSLGATPYDDLVSLRVQASVAEVLPEAVSRLLRFGRLTARSGRRSA